jgi:hypothetical protein
MRDGRRDIRPARTVPPCPIRWSFEQMPVAGPQPTYFYRTGRIRRWERFGYTAEDAALLIKYLNSRT